MSDLPGNKKRTVFTGPPGSGKTRRLLDIFNNARRTGNEDRVLFLVPDANSREHLRDLLARFAPSDIPQAWSDAGIHTPISLLRHTGNQITAGSTHLRTLTDKWVESGDLDPSKNPILATPGGRTSLAQAIGSLRKHGITADQVEKLDKNIIEADSPLIKGIQLWETWLAESGCRDDYHVLTAAAENVQAKRWETVLIDGFTEFPPLQWKLIESLMNSAIHSAVAIDRGLYPSENLLELFQKLGFEEEKSEPGSRWEKDCTLDWLARIESWAVDSPKPTSSCPAPGPDELILIEAAEPRIEAASLARQVAGCVRDGFKYSEIAIISPRMSEFRPLLESEFHRARIPVRFYTDRNLLETSPGALIDSLLAIATGDWSDESVCGLLSHPGSGVAVETAKSAIENTSERERLGEKSAWLHWAGKSDDKTASGILNRLVELVDRSSCDPPDFAKSILALAAGPLHESWSYIPDQIIRDEGWAWDKISTTLKSSARAFSDVNVERSPGGTASFLRSDLARARGRPLDRRRDCVNAVTLLSARTWSVPVAMVCNLSRDYFPRRRSPDPFLTDRIRESLDPPMTESEEFRKRELALFRVAVTRASRRLVLSRSVADSSGSPLLESVPIRLLSNWLGQDAKKLTVNLDPPEKILDAVLASDVASIAFEKRADDSSLLKDLSEKCAGNFQVTVNPERYDSVTLSRPEDLITAALGTDDRPISPSRLNDLAQCPFRFFASSLLRLSEPDRSRINNGLDPLMWGSIAHSALEKWHESGREKDFEELVTDAFRSKFTGIPHSSVSDGRVQQIILALNRFREFDQNYFGDLGFRQEYAEASFKTEAKEGEYPPVEWKLDDRHTLTLGGRIDRIDVSDDRAAFVADYKRSPSGAKSDSSALKAGRNFQLACYIALVQLGLGLDVEMAAFVPLTESGPDKLGKILAADKPKPRLKEKGIKVLDEPSDPTRHLEEAAQCISVLIERISSGSITPFPQDNSKCGSNCGFRDLCRFSFTGDEGLGEGGDS